MIVSISVILKYIIQKPIYTLKKAADSLGKGQLDTRVDIESRDELGELSSTFNDMAEDLKQSQTKIEEYNRILEKIIEQKDEFIGQLGHDLKNPLQPLVGLLPMIIEKETDPETKEALEVMHHNVEYMQNLIFSTLELAKLRSDKIKFNFEKLNLRSIVEQVLKSQALSIRLKHMEIENNLDNSIFVKADKLRLIEVFKNLIHNAIKYSVDDGGKITLDAKQIDDNLIEIGVKDTGVGMTDEQIFQAFDEYYKADEQTSDYYSTGLGLPICKRIIEKHGGTIWVESPGLGKGSTFYFTLEKVGEVND
jgi:signal transduction histidine kinase